jgi:hypothetical protein
MEARLHDTREAWLNHVAARMLPIFEQLAAPLPARLRIGIGFTSSGRRSKRIGECWDNRCSEDGHFEIFIRPDLDEPKDLLPMQVAAILGHELVHAAVGIAAGHGGEFRRVAKGIGLAGPMAATTAGPGFEKAMQPILQAAGPLPHGRLRLAGGARSHSARRNPQHPRRVKCACANCGYTIHTAGKWLALAGAPLCPNHGRMQIEQPRAPVAVSGIAPPATLALEAIDNKR